MNQISYCLNLFFYTQGQKVLPNYYGVVSNIKKALNTIYIALMKINTIKRRSGKLYEDQYVQVNLKKGTTAKMEK